MMQMRCVGGRAWWVAAVISLAVPGIALGQLDTPAAAGLQTIDDLLATAEKLVDALENADERALSQSDQALIQQDVFKNLAAVTKDDPLNPVAGYLYGRMDLLAGRPREALPRIQKYVDSPRGQTDWYAHKLLGDIFIVSYATHAKAVYAEASNLAPTEPEPLIGLARAYLKLEEAEQAVVYALMAIQEEQKADGKQDRADFAAVLADAYYKQQSYPEARTAALDAVRIAEQKIRDKPGDLKLLNELSEQYDLLKKCLQALVAIYPENAQYLVELSRTFQDHADLERVISYFQTLMIVETARQYRQFEDTHEVLYEEARLNRMVGRDDKAVTILRQILDVLPDFQPARNLLDEIEPGAK